MQNWTGLWEGDKGPKGGKGVGQTMAIVCFKVLQLLCTFKLTFEAANTSCHSDSNKILTVQAQGAEFSVVKGTEHTHVPETERKLGQM